MTNKLLIAIIAFVLFAAAGATAQTTSFVFQGKLNDGGIPANGSYQFTFTMYDAASGGNQIGQTITDLPATVSNGIFAVNLDFGAPSFDDGAARYIEVGVRLTDTGQNYTILSPRQAVSSTPYSVKSLKSEQADTAVTADNSLKLGGIAANQYVITNDSRMSDARNPLPASPNYIQNGINPQSSSNFNISGEGRANIFSADSQFNIGGFRVLHLKGNFNTFVGFETGNSLKSGSFNAVFGTSAGRMTTTGSNNSFFGSLAGHNNLTGSENSFFGQASGLRNTTGAGNSFFGYGAGVDITGGGKNTFLGFLAGQGNTNETENTFIGYKANGAAGITNATAIGANAFAAHSNSLVLGTNLVTVQVPGNLTVANTFSANALDSATVYKIAGNRVFHLTGTDSTFAGFESGNSITTGGFNAFFGSYAGKDTTSGINNAFFGSYAGRGNLTGGNNSFFGANAGLSNKASFNAFFGSAAGFSNLTGAGNSFFGTQSGASNESGQNNSFFGRSAGDAVTTGSNNTFVGALSGVLNTNTAGSNNTALGYNNKFSQGVSNSIAIGVNLTINQSNTIRIGTANDTVHLGKISAGNIESPAATFSFGDAGFLQANQIEIKVGSAAVSKFLQMTATDLEVETLFVNTELDAKAIRFRTFASYPGIQPQPLCYAASGTVKELAVCPSDFWKNQSVVASADQITALEKAVKQQQAQIQTREAENQKLQEQLKQQQAQIDALKSLVCQSNPTAAVGTVCAAALENKSKGEK